jgi:Bacterial archaeo-eukaryotic release factor family 3
MHPGVARKSNTTGVSFVLLLKALSMQKQLQAPNILQREDLKSFGNATGPCVSLYFPDHDPGEKTRQDEVRLSNAIEGAEKRLRELGFDKGAINELLDPARELARDLGPWHMEGNAFAVFRSPDVFRVYRPMKKVPEISVVGEHFYILPIVDMLRADRHFFILAISQKHVRLLRCTEYSSEEVPLPAGTPVNLEDFLNTRMPNSNEEHGTHNPEPGVTLGSFTSGTDRDRKDEFVVHFYRGVDKAVTELLRNETAPLVLAGVEQQVHLYSKITSYPNVTMDAVGGSAESLKGGELHARALPIAEQHWNLPLKKALEQYEEVGGTERRVGGVAECVRAAYEGRISHLFVGEGAQWLGTFNPDTLESRLEPDGHGNAEDLVNLAALQTILHGGEVWVLPAEKIPSHNQVAGVCRY